MSESERKGCPFCPRVSFLIMHVGACCCPSPVHAQCASAGFLTCVATCICFSLSLRVLGCRLLEVTGAKDPKALEALVTALGVPAAGVNRDLMTYKNILSKLAAAKELMREMFEREKRKAAEREAEKAKGVDAQPESSEKKEEVLS